jgi:hypothetical protein
MTDVVRLRRLIGFKRPLGELRAQEEEEVQLLGDVCVSADADPGRIACYTCVSTVVYLARPTPRRQQPDESVGAP